MTRALTALALLLPLVALPAAAQTAPPPAAAGQVDSLVALGRLQEAAWTALAAGDSARAELLLAHLDSVLRSPPLQAKPLSMESQGVSYTFRLQHPDGVEAIFKVDGSDIFCPSCGAAREVAAYRIDRLLGVGLTPLTTFQHIVVGGDTLRGSTMYFVHGASRSSELGRKKPDLLRFFDAVIGNSDRHAANWLVRADGSVVAIDHNRAFEYRPSTRPKTCWEMEVDSLDSPMSLGAPFDRYRSLPADSLAAAVSDLLEPGMAERFVAMRDKVVARIERRGREPARSLPRDDCPWED